MAATVVLTMLGLVGASGPAGAKVSGPNGLIALSRFDAPLGGERHEDHS